MEFGQYIIYAVVLTIVELILMAIASLDMDEPKAEHFPIFILKYVLGNLVFLIILSKIPIN